MKLLVGCSLDCSRVVVDAGPTRYEMSASDAEALADEMFGAALIVRDTERQQGAEDRAVDAERDRRMMEEVS